MDATDLLFKLWAKTDPFHPLPCHLVDVGNVALELLSSGPFRGVGHRFQQASGCPPEQTIAWLAYLASLHDLGKCSAAFQGKSVALSQPLRTYELFVQEEAGFRHEGLTAEWMFSFLTTQQGWGGVPTDTVTSALRGHHGNFAATADEEHPAVQQRWAELRSSLEAAIRVIFGPGAWRPTAFPHNSAAGLLLSGLVMLADWIASNRELFTLTWANESLASYAVRSRQEARRALERIGLTLELPWAAKQSFRKMWPKIKDPHPLQFACERLIQGDIRPGLVIIEALMGEGKSEAAIYLATQCLSPQGAGGLYVALPTAATSNQMHARVQEFLQQHDPRAAEGVLLVHGMSWLLDDITPERAPELSDEHEHAGEVALDWFRPPKRSLLIPAGVGTLDQALMGAMHLKHGFLRLFGLVGKVLIIDEVHAYDPYMSQILTRLLEWCGALGIPTILLSATLPQARRLALMKAYAPDVTELPAGSDQYPLISVVERSGKVRPVGSAPSRTTRIHLHRHHGLLGDPASTAALVAEQARQEGCICVIANTVDSAQAIFRHLQRRLDDQGQTDVDLLLFHARYPVKRRQEIEKAVLLRFDKQSLDADKRHLRPKRAILVATQVVEQSLDLDFDVMFTELAPIDLLLQRAGRLYRHVGRSRPGEMTWPVLHLLLPEVVNLRFGVTEKVYHPFILMRTLEHVIHTDTWSLPADIRDMVESVYDPQRLGPGLVVDLAQLTEARDDWQRQQEADAKKAKAYLIPAPDAARFVLPNKAGQVRFEDQDEGASSYFQAKTRLGDQTRKVLLVEGTAFQRELAQQAAPERHILRELHLQTVSIPGWWIKDVTPIEGYANLEDAPVWLRGTTVLRVRVQGGRWEGHTADGKRFAIQVDRELGVHREAGGVTQPSAD